MAILSSVGSRFDKFLSEIQLTDTQIKDAQTKYDGVCGKLHSKYYTTTYNGSTKLLIGSYKKRTAISPTTDIDVIFVLPPIEYKRYDEYRGNGQSQLLQDIKYILLDRYPKTKIRGDGPVVQVNFDSYMVEVVPSFLLKNGNYRIPDTHDGGGWKETSPKTEMENITNSNKLTNDNTVKLIKMIKAWKYNCSVPIKSLIIELTVIDFLKTYIHSNKSSTYYDLMVRDYFKYLLTKVPSTFIIPGTSEVISCGKDWNSKVNTAHLLAEKACECESKSLEASASQLWRQIFGIQFPYL